MRLGALRPDIVKRVDVDVTFIEIDRMRLGALRRFGGTG